jgi:hypothetical protein
MRLWRALAIVGLIIALMLAFSVGIQRGDQLPAPPRMLIWFSR